MLSITAHLRLPHLVRSVLKVADASFRLHLNTVYTTHSLTDWNSNARRTMYREQDSRDETQSIAEPIQLYHKIKMIACSQARPTQL
jgi:hypothetical protein